ncbi:S8 family serine peptidase [Flavobacterium sp. RSSA_27]|uniref:S8 family serine peptidase n=1 Tax=Flavobacterium sp. RSSA_27 TaxID=3447667 RepID=UPI003F39C14E
MKNFYKKRNPFLWFLIFTLWTVFSFGQVSTFKQGVKQGAIKVKFSGLTPQTLKNINSAKGTKPTTGIASFDKVATKVGVRKMQRLFPENANPRLEAKLKKHKLDLWYVVEFDPSMDPKAVVQNFKGVAELQSVEVERQKVLSNYQFKTVNMNTTRNSAVAAYFDDPKLGDQWHYNNTGQTGYTNGSSVNLFKAWDVVKGSPDIVVSIHDQGVDVNHPDLKANIWVNTAELNGKVGVDDDNNGYVDDLNGWNFDKKSPIIDAQPHGTHVAGTVAAVNNNGIGVAGVAGGSGKNDGAKVMSLQSLGGGSIDQTFIYAANNGAIISQNSWGYTTPGQFELSMKDAIDYFIAEAGDFVNSPMRGGIVIFAAGNSDSDDLWYPGYYDNVVTVSAIGPNWKRATYSNYGTWVDIAAPGGEMTLGGNNGVLSTLPKNQYGFFEGTSMACPHVSGIAALAIQNRTKQLTPEVLKTKLLTGVVDIDSHNPNYKGKLGVGHIDAFLAIQNNQGLAPETISDLSLKGISQEFANLSWTVPADADDAQPTEYKVYYHTSPISKSNLAAASVETFKSAALKGETINFTVNNLLGLTNYYFAVVAVDRWKNQSDISNSVMGTTNQGPKIDVDDNSKDIYIDVNAGSAFKGTHDLTVLNNADGILRWEFSTRHKETFLSFSSKTLNYPKLTTAKAASLGKVAKVNATFTKPTTTAVAPTSTTATAATFTPEEMRYSDYPTNLIGDTDISLTNSSATKFVVTNPNGFNLTHVESYLKLDPAKGPVIVEIIKGTELNKKNVIYAQEYSPWNAGEDYAFIQLDEQIHFVQGETFYVVFHVPSGNLYPLGVGYETVDSGSENCFISFDLGQSWGSLENALQSKYFAYNTAAISRNAYLGQYLTLNPSNGEVSGNTSQKTTLSADGTNLINGTYYANAIFRSNDGANKEFKVPVTLKVSGQKPVLKAEDALDFSSVFSGLTKEMELVVKNTGFGNFNNVNVQISNPNFELVGWAPWRIAAGEEVVLKVKYKPSTIGNDNGVLTLTSFSSPVSLRVVLFGVSTAPAKVEVTPMTQLVDNIVLGDQVKATVTVENKGQAALKYFVPNYDQSGIAANWKGDYHKYGYKFRSNEPTETTPVAYEYTDISSTGTDITNYFKADKNRFFPVEMGFEFPYYTKKMKTLYVSHKGFTAFDNSINPINDPGLNEAPYSPKGYISPLGTYVDLSMGGSVHYKVESDKVIVQFTNIGDGWSGALTAQMVLYADGNIRFFYDNITYDSWSLNYTNVLIEDFDQQDGILVHNNTKSRPIYSGLALGFDYPGPNIITSISNAGGLLLPGEKADLEVTMNTSTVTEGMINRYLNIISSDPFTTQVLPLIQLNITSGGVAKVVLTDTALSFGDVFQGAIAKKSFGIKNTGTAPISLNSFALDTNQFQVVNMPTSPIVLAPGLGQMIEVSMPTNTVASLSDVLRFKDSNNVDYAITLSGVVLDPPGIVVTNLDAINESLNHGEKSKHTIQFENNGIADLELVATGNNWMTMSVPVATNASMPNFTYTVETKNDGTDYQWMDLRKKGTSIELGDILDIDKFWTKVQLPWAIEYYGKSYSEVYIGQSGMVTFDKPTELAIHDRTLPNTTFKTIVAPYWTFGAPDIFSSKEDGAGLYYYSDADKFVISWEYFTNFFGGTGDPMSAQVIFYSNGTMKFQYKVNGTNDLTSNITTIGLQNEDQSDVVAISTNANLVHGNGLAYIISPAKKHVVKAGTILAAQIDIDATSLNAGYYEGNLKIRTNVPNQELLEKPVSLMVNGAAVIAASVSEIDYGKIMVNPEVSHTKEFELSNNGSDTLYPSAMTIQSGSFDYTIEVYQYTPGWGPFPGSWSWTNIDYLWGGLPAIAPGESTSYRVTYAPMTANVVNDNLVIESNATVSQLLLPIKAVVTLPPALTMQTESVTSNLNLLTDKDTQYAIFDNANGEGVLDYELSIDYLRTGILGANARKEALGNLVKNTAATSLLKSIPAPKDGIAVASVNNFNRILAYESKTAPDNFIGFNGSQPFITGTRFNAGIDGFTLSHFQTYIGASKKPAGVINYEIRAGGSDITKAAVIAQGSVNYTTAGTNAGEWITLPLVEPKGLSPNEDFYVIITYPYELAFAQGSIKGIENTYGRYMYDVDGTWYDIQAADAFPGYGWMVRAVEEKFVENKWVTINGATSGSLAPGESAKVTLDFTAAFGSRGDQFAKLNVRTNDPVQEVGVTSIKMHVNEAPSFNGIPDEVSIAENSTATQTVKVVDVENNKFTITAAALPTWASFKVTGQDLAITMAPGYDHAGTYTLRFTALDEYGASKDMAMKVLVQNTNRAPIVIKSDALMYTKLNQFDRLNFADYLADLDQDQLTFEATVADNAIASVTLGADLGIFVVESKGVGQTVITLKATDEAGLSVTQTINVTVINNRAPVAQGAKSIQFSRIGDLETLPFEDYFIDADGDPLTYSAVLEDVSLATLTSTATDFTLESLKNGESVLRVTATDIHGATAEQLISVIVSEIKDIQLNIFPNPVVNTINIKWENRWIGDVVVEIVSFGGSIVRRYEVKDVHHKKYSEFDLSALTTGVYFVKVSGQEGTSSIVKFVKR